MRKFPNVFVLILLGLNLAGCATTFEVIQPPARSADLYPLAQSMDGATVAVDEIRDGERVLRYFGVDLLERAVLPVTIVVSNHRSSPLMVKPADVMLHRSNQVIDPLPVSEVAGLAKASRRLNRETRAQVDAYYREIAFAQTAIAPHDSYQGVLFFGVDEPKSRRESFFRKVSLWMHGGMQLDIVVETADRQERLRFGPFSLAGRAREQWY